MPGGRPTKYSEEMLQATYDYVEANTDEVTIIGVGKDTQLVRKVKLPSVEGLALKLRVNKTTIYEWCKANPEFSNAIEDLKNKQAQELINNGLAGAYNPTIAKVLLSKAGYSEKTETDITTQGEKITSSILPEVIAEADRLLKERKLNAESPN